MEGNRGDVERCFDRAMEISLGQKAKSLELRAAISLADWLKNDDRTDEAIAVLKPVYGRFSEGFDTTDLRSARALLNEITYE